MISWRIVIQPHCIALTFYSLWTNWPCFCEALRLEMQVKRFELFREAIAFTMQFPLFPFCRVCDGGPMLNVALSGRARFGRADRWQDGRLSFGALPHALVGAFQSGSIPFTHLHAASLTRFLCSVPSWIFLIFLVSWDALIAILLRFCCCTHEPWHPRCQVGALFLEFCIVLFCEGRVQVGTRTHTHTHTFIFWAKSAKEMKWF